MFSATLTYRLVLTVPTWCGACADCALAHQELELRSSSESSVRRNSRESPAVLAEVAEVAVVEEGLLAVVTVAAASLKHTGTTTSQSSNTVQAAEQHCTIPVP